METHTETYRSHTITIHTDEDAQPPNEWQDDNLFLVHYHRDFQVESDVITESECAQLYCEQMPISQQDDYHIFWLTAHIHGGVYLYLGNIAEAPFDAGGWDTSHCGAVLVSKKEWADETKAHDAAQSIVNEWNDYLSGNVYGYTIDGDICDDSCWGFYGDYEKYCLLEARSSIDYAIQYAQKEHCKHLKRWILAKVGLLHREPMPA